MSTNAGQLQQDRTMVFTAAGEHSRGIQLSGCQSKSLFLFLTIPSYSHTNGAHSASDSGEGRGGQSDGLREIRKIYLFV